MEFNIDPKDLNLQDAAGMQLVEVIRNLADESGTADYEDLENLPQINGVTLVGDKSSEDLNLVVSKEQIAEEVDGWLEDNIVQETGYMLDSSLTMSNAAAPADKVGELKSALDEAIEDFAVPTQEAVDNWLNAHPEATTTVQDHSLSVNKMIIGTLGYVTPEMFGAKGDGSTDDTAAIKSAIDSDYNVQFHGEKVYVVDTASTEFAVTTAKVIDGNGCTLKCKSNAARKNIFDIQAENVTVQNFNAFSVADQYWVNGGTTYPAVPSSNLVFAKISASNSTILNIAVDYFFSAVYFSDTSVEIKDTVVVRGVKGFHAQTLVFTAHCKNVDISDVYCEMLGGETTGLIHGFYLCVESENVRVSGYTVKSVGSNVYDAISLHPSSNNPATPDIKNIVFADGSVEGDFQYVITAVHVESVKFINLRSKVASTHSTNKTFMQLQKTIKGIMFFGCEMKMNGLAIYEAPNIVSDGVSFSHCDFRFVDSSGMFRNFSNLSFDFCNIIIDASTALGPTVLQLRADYSTPKLKMKNCVIDCSQNITPVFCNSTATNGDAEIVDTTVINRKSVVLNIFFGSFSKLAIVGCKFLGFTRLKEDSADITLNMATEVNNTLLT